jgi:hypothetical protein
VADFDQRRYSCAPLKHEHDAIVARKGRPYTDTGMRATRQPDNDATDSGLSIIDQAIADSRITRKETT